MTRIHLLPAALIAALSAAGAAAANETAPEAALAGAGTEAVQAAPATPSQEMIDRAIVAQIREMLANELVHRSILAQNESYGRLSQSAIDAMDQQWRAERKSDDKPLISRTLSNSLSSYLTRVQANSMGLYAAIFVTDRNGLNVGQSAITGDYWQGDEAKFKQTFLIAPDAVFVDQPEFVDEFGFWIAQANLTMTDPATGRAIGAATVDVNLTELRRRRALGLL